MSFKNTQNGKESDKVKNLSIAVRKELYAFLSFLAVFLVPLTGFQLYEMVRKIKEASLSYILLYRVSLKMARSELWKIQFSLPPPHTQLNTSIMPAGGALGLRKRVF